MTLERERSRRCIVAGLAGAAAVVISAFANAASIIDEWSSVQAPPPPTLTPVTIDRGTTALLLLDFNKQTCNAERRPRCIASIPQVTKLLGAARAAGVPVFYSLGGGGTPADILKELTPTADEPVVSAGVDKFSGTDLESLLKKKGIKTVIVCGTSAQGVGIGTGSGAAQRGYKVIFPIDCVSAEDPYNEQYAAWHMFKGGPAVVVSATTVTRSSMIKF